MGVDAATALMSAAQGRASGPRTAKAWVAVAANPFSGARSNRPIVEALNLALRDLGLEAKLAWSPAEREEVLRDTEGCRCVVAAGGDGTVADVLNLAPTLPVAMLPLGNENLFAKEFAFTRDPRKLAQRIARGTVRAVDAGSVNGRLFTCMVTAGFDAEVVHRVAAWRNGHTPGSARKRVRRLTYAWPIFAATWGYRFPLVRLEANGETHQGAMAMAFNLPRYAMGMPFSPQAQCDDGQLDWVLLKRPGMLHSLNYTRAVWMRRLRHRGDVLHGRAAKITITALDQPVPAQADGDAAGFTPLVIEAKPLAFRVLA